MTGDWHRNLRLAEEVGDEFGGIVEPGIFEVEEAEASLVVDKRVVKAEIRWRQAALVCANRLHPSKGPRRSRPP